MVKEILVIVNRGGWGDGGLERAHEEKSVIEGVTALLTSQGWKCTLKAYERLHSPTLGTYLKALWDLCILYRQASKQLAQELQEAFSRAPQLRILLIGYSLGAVLNIATLKRLPQEPRLYSLHFGAPFFLRSPTFQRVLNLQRKGDAFASGSWVAFFLVLLKACIVAVANIGTFQGTSILDAWHIKGHDYAWDNPAVKTPVEQFLRSHFP